MKQTLPLITFKGTVNLSQTTFSHMYVMFQGVLDKGDMGGKVVIIGSKFFLQLKSVIPLKHTTVSLSPTLNAYIELLIAFNYPANGCEIDFRVRVPLKAVMCGMKK